MGSPDFVTKVPAVIRAVQMDMSLGPRRSRMAKAFCLLKCRVVSRNEIEVRGLIVPAESNFEIWENGLLNMSRFVATDMYWDEHGRKIRRHHCFGRTEVSRVRAYRGFPLEISFDARITRAGDFKPYWCWEMVSPH